MSLYQLNKLCYDLKTAANREAFPANEVAYIFDHVLVPWERVFINQKGTVGRRLATRRLRYTPSTRGATEVDAMLSMHPVAPAGSATETRNHWPKTHP